MRDLGALVARLQSTPPFSAAADYSALLAGLLEALIASGRFTPGLLDAHREGLARISEAYPWNADENVSTHHDLNPSNIIFDGERLWLVDWELAFRNDPLIDVANLANYLRTGGFESALPRTCTCTERCTSPSSSRTSRLRSSRAR